MNAERFAALTHVYGADLRRWPAAEQAAARLLLESGDAVARAALDRARALDARLDGYVTPAPSPRLLARILSAAPRPAWTWTRARLWWSGAGLAGLGLAGAALGALLITLATPALLGGEDEITTAFGQLAYLGDAADPGDLADPGSIGDPGDADLEGLLE